MIKKDTIVSCFSLTTGIFNKSASFEFQEFLNQKYEIPAEFEVLVAEQTTVLAEHVARSQD